MTSSWQHALRRKVTNVADVRESWRPSIVDAYTCRKRNVWISASIRSQEEIDYVDGLVPFSGELVPGRRVPPILIEFSVGKAALSA